VSQIARGGLRFIQKAGFINNKNHDHKRILRLQEGVTDYKRGLQITRGGVTFIQNRGGIEYTSGFINYKRRVIREALDYKSVS